MPLPPLRSLVKISPIKHNGEDAFVAQDPQEALFEQPMVLPPFSFVVAVLLDGKREAADIQVEIEKQMNGLKVPVEEIAGAVEELDKHFLLESETAAARRKEVMAEFLADPTRPARFVQGESGEVRGTLDGYFAPPAGAGAPEGRREEPVAGIMAPHIDFGRGGNCYTFAYRELAERSDADLYVVFGVAHLSPPTPFVVTAKDYDTPLGLVETDREVVAALGKRLGNGIHEFEWLHRAEHSVEFQAVFLRHVLPTSNFTILPILCSTFEPYCGVKSPSTVPRISEFLEALGECVQGRKVCVVAGVDFAHVGPVFGDQVELNKETVQWMVDSDEKSLEACGEGSEEKFWESVMADGNKRHVCGLSATYSALKMMGPVTGKRLKYDYAPDPQGGLVSFASMSFARSEEA